MVRTINQKHMVFFLRDKKRQATPIDKRYLAEVDRDLLTVFVRLFDRAAQLS
jgi:hypothetical protein